MGLLVIPGAAVALSLGSEDATETTTSTSTPTTSTTLWVVEVDVPEYDYQADLAEACGTAGLALVDKEIAGAINPVEQAALDALRPICDSAAMALPPGPEPEQQVVYIEKVVQIPVVQEVVPVPAPAPTDTTPQASPLPTATAGPDVQPSIGTYTVLGGSADIAFYPDRVEVLSTSANPGYEWEIKYEDDGRVEVRFRSETNDSKIKIQRENGEWTVTTEEHPKGEEGEP